MDIGIVNAGNLPVYDDICMSVCVCVGVSVRLVWT